MAENCRVCGRVFSEASFGGPGICAACDCGVYDAAVLATQVGRLQARLAEAENMNVAAEKIALRLAAALRVVEDNDQWEDCGARIALRAVLTDSASLEQK